MRPQKITKTQKTNNKTKKGIELSYRVNYDTLLRTGFVNISEWVGTSVALQRLTQTCYAKNTYASRNITNTIYHRLIERFCLFFFCDFGIDPHTQQQMFFCA